MSWTEILSAAGLVAQAVVAAGLFALAWSLHGTNKGALQAQKELHVLEADLVKTKKELLELEQVKAMREGLELMMQQLTAIDELPEAAQVQRIQVMTDLLRAVAYVRTEPDRLFAALASAERFMQALAEETADALERVG